MPSKFSRTDKHPLLPTTPIGTNGYLVSPSILLINAYTLTLYLFSVMQAYEARKPAYFATPAVQLIYALHASLKAITSQPMEVRFEKHRAVAAKFRSDIRQLGLKTVAQSEEYAANGMTAIWLPEGIEIPQLVPALASKGVQIAGGILVGLAGKYFRIG